MLLPRCPPNRILSTGKRFSSDPLWPPALPYLPDRIGFGNGEIAQLLLHLRVLAVHCIRLQIEEDLDYFVFRIFLFCDHRNNTFLCLMFGILRFIPTSRNQEPQKKKTNSPKKATKQRSGQRRMRRGTNREKSVVRPFFMLSTSGGKRKKPAPGWGHSNFCFLAAAKMYCNLLYVACKQ